eukprot:scaffold49965_cov32-Tisochrysis_lutea.AAC.2
MRPAATWRPKPTVIRGLITTNPTVHCRREIGIGAHHPARNGWPVVKSAASPSAILTRTAESCASASGPLTISCAPTCCTACTTASAVADRAPHSWAALAAERTAAASASGGISASTRARGTGSSPATPRPAAADACTPCFGCTRDLFSHILLLVLPFFPSAGGACFGIITTARVGILSFTHAASFLGCLGHLLPRRDKFHIHQ